MDIELIKAIWSAGFRSGVENDWRLHATAKTPKASVAWEDEIQWRIDTDTSMHLDVNDIRDWNAV